MKLPSLKIGELVARVPIIQGGMGIGVSRGGLAGAVAACGGIGVISGVQIGFQEPDFERNPLKANIRALKKEIQRARALSPNGILGVNLMVAMNHYSEMVKAAVEEKIDLIISGAGLPVELPGLVKDATPKLIPIVSSGKAAMVITKLWERKHRRLPDGVIVEGPEAGGHLGFSLKELTTNLKPTLLQLLEDVKETLEEWIQKTQQVIPVIAAGGIYTGEDIATYLKAGAAGVQMGTRFVTTHECDASLAFKMAYMKAAPEDIRLVNSPVGLPGRAVVTPFIERASVERIPVQRCYNCLKPCDPQTTPYCISKALIEAVQGNPEEGLVFTGSNGYRAKELISVKELIAQLVQEVENSS